jgi:tetrahydromethanopterin S-methyltransferase subunit G
MVGVDVEQCAGDVEGRAGVRRGTDVGALIMLGTLFGLIVLVYWLVLRYDPEARR